MDLQLHDFPPSGLVSTVAAAAIAVLLLILLASFLSRARVFCQYLKHMTGIELRPGQVKSLYRGGGRGRVRDHLIDLLIREDLSDPDRPVVTPNSEPDTSMFDHPA